MRTKSFLLIVSIITIFASCKQNTDNLEIPGIKSTTQLFIDSINNLSWELCPTDFEQAYNLGKKAHLMAQEINYKEGIALSFLRIGLAFDYKGVYDTAMYFYNKSYTVWEELGDNKGLATTLNNIGTSYYIQANYVSAMQYYLKSLKLREDAKDMNAVAQTLNNLGLIYRVQKRYDEAIAYYARSINIRTQSGDKYGVMYAEQNIGVAYEKKNIPDSALFHYNIALALAEELNDSISLASNLSNTSNIYKMMGNYKLSVDNALRSEKILRKINDQETLAYVTESIGELLAEMKEFKKAFKYIQESLELANKLGRKELELTCYEQLAKMYANSGNYQQAYNYNKLFASLRESTLNIESTKQLNELQTQYETVKKEQRIASLTREKLIESQRKSLAFGIAAILFLAVVIVILVLNQNKLRAQQKEAELRQKMLRSQMNPHFIFNALGSVQSFIFYNKSDEAINYLSNFSKLMRDILEGSVNDFISIEQDISIIENYLLLEQLRYQNKFSFKIEVEGAIENLQIPPMLTQPFIENALKHGVGNLDKGGEIIVSYIIIENEVTIEVLDNGPGIAIEKSNTDHKSYAISLTKQRLKILGKGCRVNLISTVNELNKGTKVVIYLPKQICKNEFYD